MKLVKKILAGALSLAVICGAMFAFVGCDGMRGTTYAYEGLTFTIVTEFEDDAKIGTEEAKVKTTQTLTAREFYLYKAESKKLEELATATTEATSEEIEEWCNNYIRMQALKDLEMEAVMYEFYTEGKFTFGRNTLEIVYDAEPSEVTGDYERVVKQAEYTLEEDVITVILSETEEETQTVNSNIITFNKVGEKVEKRYNIVVDAEDYKKGELMSFAVVMAEVK